MSTSRSGFTLVELAIVLAILGIIIGPAVAIIAGELRIPVKISAQLAASQQVQKGTLLLVEDATTAKSYSPGSEPDYGTFSWLDLSGNAALSVTSRYYWDNGDVYRVLTRGDDVVPPQVVITGVPSYGDVVFQYTASGWTYDQIAKTWSYAEGWVSVSFSTRHEAGAEFEDIVFSTKLYTNLRPKPDLPAPLPGRLPPPPPVPNQIEFRVQGNPALVTGSLRGGSGADLAFDDTNYYVVAGAGSPRTVDFRLTSEAIDYTTITDASVSFVGRANRAGASHSIYVYNPTDPAHTDNGYSTTPDLTTTYSTADTDQKVILILSSDDLAYINTLNPKTITIKVKATYSALFELSSDQVLFVVGGTPSPTFFRDYFLEADPTIEAGSYISGSYSNLSTDDTAYFTVQEVGDLVTWSATSQPVTLDNVSSIQVLFTARSSKGAPAVQIFVFNPANGGDGYKVSPDATGTLSSTADATISFYLSAADLDYVRSLFPKEVRIKVKGTDTTVNWQLQADRLAFRVTP